MQIKPMKGDQFKYYKDLQKQADYDINTIKDLDDGFKKQLNALIVDIGLKNYNNKYALPKFSILSDNLLIIFLLILKKPYRAFS